MKCLLCDKTMQSEYNKDLENYLYYCHNRYCHLHNIKFTEEELQDNNKAIDVIIKNFRKKMNGTRDASLDVLERDRRLIGVMKYLSAIKRYKFNGKCPVCKQEMTKGKGYHGETYRCTNQDCLLGNTVEIYAEDIVSKEKLLDHIYGASNAHYWLFGQYWIMMKDQYKQDLNTFSRLFKKMNK